MANTSYGVNHPLAVKLWAKRLFQESIKETYVSKFLGEGSNAVIQTKNELKKGKGDRIRVGLRVLLTGAGVSGDNVLEGNEEALTTYNQDVLIDQLRHAVRSGGAMSEQRVPFSVREEAMTGLKDWWAERIETVAANHLVGNSGQTNLNYTGFNTPTAPSSSNVLYANSETAEGSISSGANWNMTVTMLDKAVVKAKTNSPKIRPVRINGSEWYVVFMHPHQTYQLRTSTSTGQWLDIQKAAFAAMDSAKDNPIFTGAMGVYNQCILHEWSYLPVFASTGSGNIVRRAVLCGAQSAIMATGNDSDVSSMNWVEKRFDYDNELGVSGGLIFGMVKSVFNSQDFGTITMSTGSPAPT